MCWSCLLVLVLLVASANAHTPSTIYWDSRDRLTFNVISLEHLCSALDYRCYVDRQSIAIGVQF